MSWYECLTLDTGTKGLEGRLEWSRSLVSHTNSVRHNGRSFVRTRSDSRTLTSYVRKKTMRESK